MMSKYIQVFKFHNFFLKFQVIASKIGDLSTKMMAAKVRKLHWSKVLSRYDLHFQILK